MRSSSLRSGGLRGPCAESDPRNSLQAGPAAARRPPAPSSRADLEGDELLGWSLGTKHWKTFPFQMSLLGRHSTSMLYPPRDRGGRRNAIKDGGAQTTLRVARAGGWLDVGEAVRPVPARFGRDHVCVSGYGLADTCTILRQ